MTENDPQISFPVSAIRNLSGLKSPAWDDLIESLIEKKPEDPDVIGFALMMTRQCACHSCSSDSFRMLKGCDECGKQAIRRNKTTDEVLISTHTGCVKEISTIIKERNDE